MTQQNTLGLEEFRKMTKAKGSKRMRGEEKIQVAVCAYLKAKYPKVIFMCDLASGMGRLGPKIGGMNTRLRSSRGMPDLFIAKPVDNYIQDRALDYPFYKYHGLFLELKNDNATVHLKNGKLSSNKHIQDQAAILERLRKEGYRAEFAVGYNEAIRIIDEYLS